MRSEAIPQAGSFRDPSGQVFVLDSGQILRTVNPSIREDFEHGETSGLFASLIEKGWLVDYERTDPDRLGDRGRAAACVLEHPTLPLVSYAYEWPFPALQAAALRHLDVHLAALERDMTLSDSSAYNIQFIGPRPVFIDILSFVRYREGALWAGHKQFCEQFLNPLLLRAYFGISHNVWYRGALEGIPVDDLARLLPWWRRYAPRPLMHVTLQSALQRRAGSAKPSSARSDTKKVARLPRAALIRMLTGLRQWIESLEPRKSRTVWQDYADQTSYDDEETRRKKAFIAEFVRHTGAATVWDLGCNTGNYLIEALNAGASYGVGFDFDQGALDAGFARATREKLPIQFLWLDAANPSPNQGWAEAERSGLGRRSSGDAVFALAFVHHLAIARNVPLDRLIEWLVSLAPAGVIEFVPKSDPMVQVLLQNRPDIFPDYTEDTFRALLGARAEIVRDEQVSAAGRRLFGFSRRATGGRTATTA